MSRGGSHVQPGCLYHVISRFVAKEWLMKGPLERNMYLSLLASAMEESDWKCFAYALMSSHIHLALWSGMDSLASWMRPMHTKFADWLNEHLERIGAVFVKGPNVIELQAEGAARLINYIHFNPVRANVVSTPESSDWTSHRAYVGARQPQRWLDVGTGLQLAGFADGADFGAWAASTRVERRELDAYRVHPIKRPGPKSKKQMQLRPGCQTTSFLVSNNVVNTREMLIDQPDAPILARVEKGPVVLRTERA